MALRPALPEEAPALSELARAAKEALGYAPELLRLWRDELHIDAEQIRRQTVRVAQGKDRIIGFFCMKINQFEFYGCACVNME